MEKVKTDLTGEDIIRINDINLKLEAMARNGENELGLAMIDINPHIERFYNAMGFYVTYRRYIDGQRLTVRITLPMETSK